MSSQIRNDGSEELLTEFRKVKEDYLFDPDVMNVEDERTRKLKWIVQNRLDTVDRTIIVLYCETQSLRKLGKLINVSYTTMEKEVRRIRKKILKEYAKGDCETCDADGDGGFHR